jgi:poly(A) polymerase
VGVTSAIDRLLLAGESIEAIRDWTPPLLPLTGGALVERGIGKGPEVARLLRMIETRWIAEDFPDVDRVSDIANEVVAQA